MWKKLLALLILVILAIAIILLVYVKTFAICHNTMEALATTIFIISTSISIVWLLVWAFEQLDD